MKVIAISGPIGWDVAPKDIRAQLDEAAGEDIEVQVSSPGGLVYDGLEIYNLIKRYPGAVTTRLMGLAASMASYIVMVGDRIIAEDNAVLMIHNARAIAAGDHNTMRKAAGIVEGLSRTIGRAYERKTGKTREEIAELMDNETFLYGQEMADEGFVDEVVPAPDADQDDDKAAAISRARAEIEKCEKLIREVEEPETYLKIAAMLGDMTPPEAPYPNEHSARVRDPDEFEKDSFRRKNIAGGVDIIIGRLKGEKTLTTQAYRFDASKFTVEQAKKWLKDHNVKYKSFEPARKEKKSFIDTEIAGVAGNTVAKADGIIDTRRGTMTLEELKRDHPDLYAAVFAAGHEAGVIEERKRIEQLDAWADADPACKQVVAEAKASGKSVDEAMPRIYAAIREAVKPKGDGDDNPPDVNTATQTTGSGAAGETEEQVREKAKALVDSLPKD